MIKITKDDLYALKQDLHIIAHGITDINSEHKKYEEFIKQKANAVLLAGQNIENLLERILSGKQYA